MKRLDTFKLFALIISVVSTSLLSLNVNAENYARIKILSGGAPTFIFNSLRKYNDGVTLVSWTKLRLELNETVPGYNKWQLAVMANTPVIESDGSATLGLNSIYIRIESYDLLSNTTVSDDWSPLELSTGSGPYGDILLEGTGVSNVVVEVSLSYDCGTGDVISNQLLGAVPDYYAVDLLFRLYSVP
jgi:hypothetical protein